MKPPSPSLIRPTLRSKIRILLLAAVVVAAVVAVKGANALLGVGGQRALWVQPLGSQAVGSGRPALLPVSHPSSFAALQEGSRCRSNDSLHRKQRLMQVLLLLAFPRPRACEPLPPAS
jgi:hypothetical protein